MHSGARHVTDVATDMRTTRHGLYFQAVGATLEALLPPLAASTEGGFSIPSVSEGHRICADFLSVDQVAPTGYLQIGL
jgi:hypothetical protein